MSLREELLRRFPRLSLVPLPAWVVGGAVRDLLLGLEPVDADVAVTDPIAAARAAGPRVIRLGKEELSAWRIVDGERIYDFAAIVGGSLESDLNRRDFTINALAVDLKSGELIDRHQGQDDLRAGIIRCITPANFDDDPLRLLKAVRMAIRFGFTIDAVTAEAILARASAIGSVAGERVGAELSLIFSARQFRRAIGLLRETGLDVPLLGEVLDSAAFHSDDVSLAASMALLVRDPRAFAARWKWSGSLLQSVLTLRELRADHSAVALFTAGETIASQLPGLLRALGEQDVVGMPDFTLRPLLDGEAIGQITGLPEGRALGAIVRRLLEAQLAGAVTTGEQAERFVRDAAGF
jgi:tRNA nucleotidyltransferase/poly(A) polymerase